MSSRHDAPTRLLVTGFEPFAGSTLNPSQAVTQAIESGELAVAQGVEMFTALLPVDTQRIEAEVQACWSRYEPDIVLHLGESAKAGAVVLERVAINLLDFDLPDNAGQQVTDRPIDPSGPAARFSTLPMRALKQRLESEGVGVELSLSAGSYLCNQALYLSLAQAQQRGGRVAGFVHLPSLSEQVRRGEREAPALPREQLMDQIQRLITHVIDLEKAG